MRVRSLVDAIFDLSPQEKFVFFKKYNQMEKIYSSIAPFAIIDKFPLPEEIGILGLITTENGQFIKKTADAKTNESTLQGLFLNAELLERLGLPIGLGGASAAAVQQAEVEEEAAPVVEEKTSFNVELTSMDEKQKLKVIKELKNILGLGLKEAKTLTESAPTLIKENLKKEEAEELAEKLKALGCEITLK